MPFKKNQKQSAALTKSAVVTKKAPIPAAMREQVWLRQNGKVYESKCPVTWCQNTITVYDFESGHNIPESKGGKTTPENLIPICSRCNKSMGNRYTITDWCALGSATPSIKQEQIDGKTQQNPPFGGSKDTFTEPTKPWWICCA